MSSIKLNMSDSGTPNCPSDGSGPSNNGPPDGQPGPTGINWKKMAIGATVGTVAGVGLAVATPTIILPALGFGAVGIGKATVAAGIHSTIGIVAKGSWFAAAQSAGAVGAVSSATTGVISAAGTAGGAVVGGAGSAISWLRGKKPDSDVPKPTAKL